MNKIVNGNAFTEGPSTDESVRGPTFVLFPRTFRITRDARSVYEIHRNLTENWRRSLRVDSEEMKILSAKMSGSESARVTWDVEVIFLASDRPVSAQIALNEMARQCLLPAVPSDVIRVVEIEPTAPWMANNGHGNHTVVFINRGDLTRSICLKYDGMCYERIYRVDVSSPQPSIYSCFAAYRRSD